MTVLLVCFGAAVGAPLRYLTDQYFRARFGTRFPWGTFAVNVAGCLVLGTLLGLAAGRGLSQPLTSGLGTGFCGALTTYSTFGYETVQLFGIGEPALAVLYVAGSLLTGLAVGVLGFVAGHAI